MEVTICSTLFELCAFRLTWMSGAKALVTVQRAKLWRENFTSLITARAWQNACRNLSALTAGLLLAVDHGDEDDDLTPGVPLILHVWGSSLDMSCTSPQAYTNGKRGARHPHRITS